MTINYKEKSVNGIEWQRCNAITILNSYNTVPLVRFEEETVIQMSESYLTKPVIEPIMVEYNPTKTFEVLNLSDNTPTGVTMSYEDVYKILYSLYIQVALERDAAANP